MLRRVVSATAAIAVLLAMGAVGSAALAGAASGDLVVIGDQTSQWSGPISSATGSSHYQPGPVAGLPTTTVDPVGHTVTLAVQDARGSASITLAWPMRPGVWHLGLDQADPEQRAFLTQGTDRCTFISGVLDVHRAETAPDGGVAVLSADVNGDCPTPGGPYLGAAVRIGDTEPGRALAIPRAEPSSFSSGAVTGTVVHHHVAVTNSGNKPWKVNAVGTAGGVPLFRVDAGSDTCTGVTLAPAQQCSVSVSATAPTHFIYEHLVITGDATAFLVVPLRLEGFAPVATPTGASTLPGRLATTVTWDAPPSQPNVGYRVYDTTGGNRTLVASAAKTETSMVVPGSGTRSLALVAANSVFAESPDVVLNVPAVTSEVVANDWYGISTAFSTDVSGAHRPTRVERVDLDPTRRLWVTARFSNVSICRVDTEVCTAVPGTATSSNATDPQEAVFLPDGTIAFIRGWESSTRTLWVVDQDGSGLRQVAAVPERSQLTAAPSGAEVVVYSVAAVLDGIERIRLSDGKKTTVPGTSLIGGFTVSNRGLLVLDRPAQTQTSTPPASTTVVMNLDGSGARVLPLPVGANRNVTFDPTGTKVAYSVYTAPYESSVWVAKADGSSARPLSGSLGTYVYKLSWSVDNSATPTALLGGPAYSTRDVTLSVGATDADDSVGSLRRECRLDAATTWSACPATFDLRGLGAGRHTAFARATDPNGHQSAVVTRSWTVDDSAPAAVVSTLPAAQVKSPITLAWTATDAGGSLLSTYDVRARTASPYGALGGFQYPTSWKGLRTRTLGVNIPPGYQFCLSVRARDTAGNIGLWSAERCTSMTLDDRALTASSGWARGTSTAYAFGTYSRAVTAGVQLTGTGIQGRRIAVIAATCPACGSLDVYHGGIKIGRVNLYSSTTRTRQAIWLGTHSVTLTGAVVLRSTSSKAVYVDGIVVGH